MNYQPNYYNSGYYNPYPQYQANPQQLHGRIVNSANDILPNEVSMDGTISFFPLSDGSGVIGKQWNSDGTIRTYTYANTNADISNEQTSSFEETVMSKLNALTEQLNTLIGD